MAVVPRSESIISAVKDKMEELITSGDVVTVDIDFKTIQSMTLENMPALLIQVFDERLRAGSDKRGYSGLFFDFDLTIFIYQNIATGSQSSLIRNTLIGKVVDKLLESDGLRNGFDGVMTSGLTDLIITRDADVFTRATGSPQLASAPLYASSITITGSYLLDNFTYFR